MEWSCWMCMHSTIPFYCVPLCSQYAFLPFTYHSSSPFIVTNESWKKVSCKCYICIPLPQILTVTVVAIWSSLDLVFILPKKFNKLTHYSCLSNWNRSVLRRCTRIPSMSCFLTMMWGCILGLSELSQKKWRRILRSAFLWTPPPFVYCPRCINIVCFCGWQIFIQTGYPLDLPSGSLGSYCIYEYHMVWSYLIRTIHYGCLPVLSLNTRKLN